LTIDRDIVNPKEYWQGVLKRIKTPNDYGYVSVGEYCIVYKCLYYDYAVERLELSNISGVQKNSPNFFGLLV
jgi:hypothetical protein